MIWSKLPGAWSIGGTSAKTLTPIPPSYSLTFKLSAPATASLKVWVGRKGQQFDEIRLSGTTVLRFPVPVDGLRVENASGLDFALYGCTERGEEVDPDVRGTIGTGGNVAAGAVCGADAISDAPNAPPVLVAGVERNSAVIEYLPLESVDQGNIRVPVFPGLAEQLFDGNVAGGAAINSGVLNVARFSQVYAVLENFSLATGRTLFSSLVRADTSEVAEISSGGGAGQTVFVSHSRAAVGTTAAAASAIGSTRRFSVSAAGVDAARLTIWGMP